MDSADSLGWEMDWGQPAVIWDTMWVAGLVVVFLYAMYTRAVGDHQPAVIETSNPDERHESTI